MRLSDAAKGRPAPAPQPQQAHGVREVNFRSDGAYRRDDVRAMVNRLRNGIPDPTSTVDELGIGLCGLLEGGRFAHCEAAYCYPSVHAMRLKAYSTGHGNESRGENPIPAGYTVADPSDEFDSERVNAKLRCAVQMAEAMRQQAAASDPGAIAAAQMEAEYQRAEALRQLATAINSVDAAQTAEARQEIADVQAQVAAIEAQRQGGG